MTRPSVDLITNASPTSHPLMASTCVVECAELLLQTGDAGASDAEGGDSGCGAGLQPPSWKGGITAELL